MTILFGVIIFVIIYHYFLFPIITIFWANFFKRSVKKGNIFPPVTLVIAAYNEEKIIREKLVNCSVLDYPKEMLEIIVISDGSTDSTPNIVSSFQDQGVISLFSPPRRGKTSALNRAVAVASGEIIVFSDANSMYKSDAITKLVANFADKSVGGVCGRKCIVHNEARESSEGDSLFWNFESFIKKQQSKAGSITTGDGEIFAIRKSLYKAIPEEIINDDTAITFQIIEQGFRIVYEPDAISAEEASIVLKDDFNVKVRMVCGGYQTLQYFGKTIFPPRNFFAVQFFSHKVLRWSMPLWLFALLAVNSFLLTGYYYVFLCLQVTFYLLALTGFIIKKTGRDINTFLYIPLYYCIMNFAAFKGLIVFFKNESQVNIWKKADR